MVYGRPLPLKASAAASSGAAGSMGVRRKEEKKFTKTPMGKKYEKKFEYQDPATFAGPEASSKCTTCLVVLNYCVTLHTGFG